MERTENAPCPGRGHTQDGLQEGSKARLWETQRRGEQGRRFHCQREAARGWMANETQMRVSRDRSGEMQERNAVISF